MIAIRRSRLVVALVSAWMAGCGAEASRGAATPPAAPGVSEPGADRILVSFKIDPLLQGGTYGGEAWISPPTYTGIANQDTIEARAHRVDPSGAPTSAGVDWTPSDPDMVTVSPPRGEAVTIVVRLDGVSTLRMTSGDVSRELTIARATSPSGVVQVVITQ